MEKFKLGDKGYNHLLRYLSEKTSIPLYDEIDITFEENYARKYRESVWVRVKGFDYQVHIQHRKGGIKVMSINISPINGPIRGNELPLDYPIEKMFYKKHRGLKDFGIEVKVQKSAYKHCEGGGWTSMVDILEVDGHQFINLSW